LEASQSSSWFIIATSIITILFGLLAPSFGVLRQLKWIFWQLLTALWIAVAVAVTVLNRTLKLEGRDCGT
jgi:hypothetical protein